jgi:hypothetical protein
MRSNLILVEAECERTVAMLQGLPSDDPALPYLQSIHESLSNIVNTMRANLISVS